MDASREVSLVPFNVRRSRRTVRWQPRHRTIPLRRSSGLSRTHAFRPARPCGFHRLAPRFLSSVCLRRRPCGSFAGDVFRPRTGPAPGPLSRPGRTCYRPATLLGFARSLRSVHPTRGRSSPHRCDRAHLPFRAVTRREFHRRGVRHLRRAMGLVPRLLGFAVPSSQPYRAVRRPRHGFCA